MKIIFLLLVTFFVTGHNSLDLLKNKKKEKFEITRPLPDKFKVQFLTYNTNEQDPPEDFAKLFNLQKFSSTEDYVDLYVIGLQESKFPSVGSKNVWYKGIKSTFEEHGYYKVDHIQMVGVYLLIYTQKEWMPFISDIQSNEVKTGMKGMMGNKGAVAIHFKVNNIAMTFVNAHFHAHEEDNDKRIADYHSIINQMKPTILDNDYIFWMGDLNFRVIAPSGSEINKIVASIKDGDYTPLLENDQLRKAMNNREIFKGFKEIGDIKFPPTFKFIIGTNEYRHDMRKPSWTDRILYKVNDERLSVTTEWYKSHMDFFVSDHKPVTGKVIITLPKLN